MTQKLRLHDVIEHPPCWAHPILDYAIISLGPALAYRTHVKEPRWLQVYTKNLDRHYWPIFRSGYVRDAEAWPADNVGIANVLVSVDPLLQTKVFTSDVLVDMDVGWEQLFLLVCRNKHLVIRSVMRFACDESLTLCRAKGARLYTSEPGLASIGGISLDTTDVQLPVDLVLEIAY